MTPRVRLNRMTGIHAASVKVQVLGVVSRYYIVGEEQSVICITTNLFQRRAHPRCFSMLRTARNDVLAKVESKALNQSLFVANFKIYVLCSHPIANRNAMTIEIISWMHR
jgi:hypothetical protein